jgi:hypothetical protein
VKNSPNKAAKTRHWRSQFKKLGEQFMFFNCVTGLEGCANKIGVEKPIFEPCFCLTQ